MLSAWSAAKVLPAAWIERSRRRYIRYIRVSPILLAANFFGHCSHCRRPSHPPMLTARPGVARLRRLAAPVARAFVHEQAKGARRGVERTAKTQLGPPRLDYARFIADPEATKRNAEQRRVEMEPGHVERLVEARTQHLDLEKQLNAARAEHGESSSLYRDVKKKRAKKDFHAQSSRLKGRVKELEAEYKVVDAAIAELAGVLPNWSHPDAPVGPEANAVEVDRFGPAPTTAQVERDHVHIAKHFGWLDTGASTMAVGASWPFMVGAFAQLEHAIINYALTIVCKHGYTPVSPPNVVVADVARRCGFQPRDGVDGPKQTYFLQNDKDHDDTHTLCLAGTAEIPLAAMMANSTTYRAALPTKIVAVGRAYRAEAGARGLDTRGLYRVHEFTKVEMFNVTAPEESDAALEDLRAIQKEIAQGLGLTVR